MTEPIPAGHPFQEAVEDLQVRLMDMAGRAEEAVRLSVESLAARDSSLAEQVRRSDDVIDTLEVEIDERVVELLALQHPVARDLRLVFTILKVSNDLERIGDHAVNIAKAGRRLTDHPPLPSVPEVAELGDVVQTRLAGALAAFVNRDAEAAKAVARRDKRADELRRSLFRILVSYMLEQPRYISPGLETILVAQNLERVGDLATNIAEDVVFLVEGRSIKHVKPGDV